MRIVYKIQHTVSKQFSKGGVYSGASGTGYYWTANGGKIWNTLGQLRGFITRHINAKTDMTEWKVIEISITVVSEKNVSDVIDPQKLIDILSK